MKIKSLDSVYKATWRLMSKYIRLRDNCVCFTCGKRCVLEECHAGHFIHGGANKYSYWLDFDERNISTQCVRCNYHLHGNLGIYAQKLQIKYGSGILDILQQQKWNPKPFSIEDLEKLQKILKENIKILLTKNII